MMNQLLQRALLLIVLGGGYLLSRAWAQTQEQQREAGVVPRQHPAQSTVAPEAIPTPPRRPDSPADAFGRRGSMGRHGFGKMRGRGPFAHPMSEEEMQEFEALGQAVEKLKSAKNDADKTSATNQIS